MEVVWSNAAKLDLTNLLEYLNENWSIDVIRKFELTLNKSVKRIKDNPNSNIVSSKRKNLRRIVLTKHNSLFYRITNNRIEIIRLFDTRQNPKKL